MENDSTRIRARERARSTPLFRSTPSREGRARGVACMLRNQWFAERSVPRTSRFCALEAPRVSWLAKGASRAMSARAVHSMGSSRCIALVAASPRLRTAFRAHGRQLEAAALELAPWSVKSGSPRASECPAQRLSSAERPIPDSRANARCRSPRRAAYRHSPCKPRVPARPTAHQRSQDGSAEDR